MNARRLRTHSRIRTLGNERPHAADKFFQKKKNGARGDGFDGLLVRWMPRRTSLETFAKPGIYDTGTRMSLIIDRCDILSRNMHSALSGA